MPVLMLCDLLVKQMVRDRTFPKLSTTHHKAQGDVFLPLIGVNINFTTARICRFREVMFSTVCLFTGGGGVSCHWSVWGPYLPGSVNMYSLIPPPNRTSSNLFTWQWWIQGGVKDTSPTSSNFFYFHEQIVKIIGFRPHLWGLHPLRKLPNLPLLGIFTHLPRRANPLPQVYLLASGVGGLRLKGLLVTILLIPLVSTVICKFPLKTYIFKP